MWRPSWISKTIASTVLKTIAYCLSRLLIGYRSYKRGIVVMLSMPFLSPTLLSVKLHPCVSEDCKRLVCLSSFLLREGGTRPRSFDNLGLLRVNVWEKRAKSVKGEKLGSAKLFHNSIIDRSCGLTDKYVKFALQVFWYRRYEIHSPSPPQVLVFLVNLTQIWRPAKTVKFSERSSCFVPDTNGHRPFC